MFGDQVADEAGSKTPRSRLRALSAYSSITERYARETMRRPGRETHSCSASDRFWQNALHAPAQDVFGRQAAQFHPLRQPRVNSTSL